MDVMIILTYASKILPGYECQSGGPTELVRPCAANETALSADVWGYIALATGLVALGVIVYLLRRNIRKR